MSVVETAVKRIGGDVERDDSLDMLFVTWSDSKRQKQESD
jgi:hypothetical protein